MSGGEMLARHYYCRHGVRPTGRDKRGREVWTHADLALAKELAHRWDALFIDDSEVVAMREQTKISPGFLERRIW